MINILIILLLILIVCLLVYIIFFKKCKCNCNCASPSVSASAVKDMDIKGLDGEPKDWILMVKLCTGGDNCSKDGTAYSCNFMYAVNENTSLQLGAAWTIDSKDF